MKNCSWMATERFFEGVQHAKNYATFRPRPPEQLTERIVAYLKEKYEGQLDLCVDVGCGNGQCSTPFAHHFHQVLATDVSSAQIQVANALVHPVNVEFRNCTAESIPATAGSTQLVNASTAAHWFNLPAFFQEANRVLCSNGVIALSSYGLASHVFIHPAKSTELHQALFHVFYGELNVFPSQTNNKVWNIF
uniref:Putative Ubie/coq5 methyltransferase n=1 Tax=Daphnia magna TaxID=35525 RepID=A0A0P5KI83_9CRUS